MSDEINSELRRAIRVLLPWDGVPGFIAALESGKVRMRGLNRDRLFRYLVELELLGLISTEYTDEAESDVCITVSSIARAEVRDRRIGIVKAVGRYLFQLLVGSVGGLVVFGLGWLASH